MYRFLHIILSCFWHPVHCQLIMIYLTVDCNQLRILRNPYSLQIPVHLSFCTHITFGTVFMLDSNCVSPSRHHQAIFPSVFQCVSFCSYHIIIIWLYSHFSYPVCPQSWVPIMVPCSIVLWHLAGPDGTAWAKAGSLELGQFSGHVWMES